MLGHRPHDFFASRIMQLDQAIRDLLVVVAGHPLSFAKLIQTDDASSK